MRIVGGMHRGRVLVAPKGHSTRPTADRTRQAIFNILEHAAWSPGLEGRRAIDLFAGAGALGLEALSRGAAFCLFVDTDAAARAAIGANVQALRLESRARVDGRDATRLGPAPESGEKFDLAFLDPPYGQGLNEPALAALAKGGWLAPGALIVVERGTGEAPLAVPGFEIVDSRGWGAARVEFLRSVIG
ncbi:MAG: 16S rRNA (guanine(966)-N(2))-methyltransferase RsmD [Pseudomonadota bacterium]|nr:16S rRNA (guanine(966)-N(2))-methyltransferase RsmD [Pseudomonadota bacterium]